jgi:hypothetical protein
MTHFPVMVFGENPKQQLAPFHEFECTGINNEYIQDIDETERFQKEYTEDTKTRYKGPDGTLYQSSDNLFYRDPTPEESSKLGSIPGSGWCGPIGKSYTSRDWGDGKGYRVKIHDIPEEYQEVKVPWSDYGTFLEYVDYQTERDHIKEGETLDLEGKHKYGYIIVNTQNEVVKVINRTNPNAKWDWYQIGGRWAGYFQTYSGRVDLTGNPGLMGANRNYGKPGYADQARLEEIDFDGMIRTARQKAKDYWEKAHKYTEDFHFEDNFQQLTKELGFKEGKKKFWDQPFIKAVNKSLGEGEEHFWGPGWPEIKELDCPLDEYLDKTQYDQILTYSYVKDKQWVSKGDMGWWGVSHDKIETSEWQAQFMKHLRLLPGDTLVTLVDCHI